jgi:deazaflavin-dependent oxidoreductase (nitroreductase family)
MTSAAVRLYRLTRGRVLGHIGGQPVLLLETIGRRTGRRRTTPLQYLADDEAFVVVASNRGAAHPPAWYLNLRAHPGARVQVGARTIDVRAHQIDGDERDERWDQMTAGNRHLEDAARKAGRSLPLVTLTPRRSAGERPPRAGATP